MSQQHRRYPGLNYFTTEQKDQFFGRDAEKEDLLALVQTEKIVALFGKSGYGKSSLIRAGLIPILPPNVLPIIVNFGAYQKGQSVSLLQKTVDNLHLALPKNAAEMDFLNAQSEAVTQSHRLTTPTLWQHFKQKQSAAPRSFLLIFDQFEEFDSYPPEQRAAFKQQLAELLYTRIPQALRDRSDALTDEQQALLARPLEVRALFAIREDRLSVLDALADRLPEILYKRFHLRGLADAQAQAAIVEPALLAGEQFESPRFRYTPEAVAAILRGLKKDDSEALVESFLLQICCEEIERSVIGRRETEPTVTAAQLPVFRDLFEQYYRNKIAALPDEATRRAARRMIEDQLVAADPATGIAYRVNVDGRTLLALPGVDDALLRRLTDAFLLRSEPNTTGGFSYEVSHDRLVEGILILKTAYEAEEAERLRLEAIAAEEARIAAEKADADRRRRRALVTALVAGALILGAMVATVLALQKTQEATVQAENARLATEEAERQKQAAATAERRAGESENRAAEKTKQAERAETAAEAAERKASETLSKLQQETDAKTPIFMKAVKEWEIRNRYTLKPDEWKTKVDSLRFSWTSLLTLPVQVYECKNLKVLNLNVNPGMAWGDVLSKLSKLKNLTSLDLSENQLTALSVQIGELKNLTSLDLGSPDWQFKNQLTSLPAEIWELKKLTTLDLNSNKLTALPTEIGGVKNLTDLNLSGNELTTLPAEIGGLKNLTDLNLSVNKLIALPATFGGLKNLTDLNLSGNELTTLPAEIGELKKLTDLNLSGNELTTLPAEIGGLKKLTDLNLSGNELTTLPAEIGGLKNLTDLNLRANKLIALPAEIGGLKNLTDLNLSVNKLIALPAEIGGLKNLTKLNLERVELIALPADIGELKNLTWLDLSDNQLTALPAEIGGLKNLTWLDLSDNQLTALPAEIGELKNLTTLGLAVNKLTALPAEIGELKNLTWLGLSGNPIPEAEQERIRRLVPAGCKVLFDF